MDSITLCGLYGHRFSEGGETFDSCLDCGESRSWWEELEVETNSSVTKKLHRRRLYKEHGTCDRCPPHSGENARTTGKKPRGDHYKSRRKGRS